MKTTGYSRKWPHTKKYALLSLKIVGIIAAVILFLVLALLLSLHTRPVQNMVVRHATYLLADKLDIEVCADSVSVDFDGSEATFYGLEEILEKKLATNVDIDSVAIDFMKQEVKLYRLLVEDREQRPMLQVEQLDVTIDFMPLLKNDVRISSATVRGLSAELYKPSPDQPANYQFVIDAFKKEKKDSTGTDNGKNDTKKKNKKPLLLDIKKLLLERISVTYNDSHAELEKLEFAKTLLGHREGTLNGLKASFVRQTKKGPQDCTAAIGQLAYKEGGNGHMVDIQALTFATDNHLPRKNAGKPSRGAFDDGHLNATANLQLVVTQADKDTLTARLEHLDATDKEAGIELVDLHADIAASKRQATLSNVAIQLKNTLLTFESAQLQLPSKKENRGLSYRTSPVTGKVLLRDIARPFAPTLSKFSIPLDLKVTLSGDDNSMDFNDISVATKDRRLQIAARGTLRELKDKYKMAIRFNIGKMTAKGSVKQDIINQFPVKKFMMKQLDAMGTVGYKGNIAILWKREEFRGLLTSEVGSLDFNFALDEANKYVVGTAKTSNLEVGRAFDVDNLGPVVAEADFKFDISKSRTAKMRQQKGGKLPIGTVAARVSEASWKKLKVRNIVADIMSDGAVAEGKLTVKGKRTDLLCSFSFTNTESVKSKLKVKPGIKFHGLSDEDKAEKERVKKEKADAAKERRQQKEAEKAAQKQQKAAQKEERKQERAAKAEERKQERAAKAEERKQEKAAKKALKAEEKAERKRKKEAEKAERQQSSGQ